MLFDLKKIFVGPFQVDFGFGRFFLLAKNRPKADNSDNSYPLLKTLCFRYVGQG